MMSHISKYVQHQQRIFSRDVYIKICTEIFLDHSSLNVDHYVMNHDITTCTVSCYVHDLQWNQSCCPLYFTQH